MGAEWYGIAVFIQEKRDTSRTLIEAAKPIVEPHWVLASSKQQAELLAAAEVPEKVRENPDLFDRVVVATVPF